ncbi:MAG: PhoH family protein [Deltaproteobacteria bacterium]
MKKCFVLDTNVLLHNAESLHSFVDNAVVLPMSVIEELDKFKSRNDELGRNARQVIRDLDHLRELGRLSEGVRMENGGTLKIVLERSDNVDDYGMDMSVADNRILSVAYSLHQKGDKVIFVSKDINARLKADALGIEVMDFEKQKVKFDELYTGNRQIKVPRQVIDDYYQQETLGLEGFDLFPNEFILLRDEEDPKHSALAKVKNERELVHLNPKFETAWQIRTRSKEQRMAMELLMDPEVEVVTLVGQAGTGKTLLALAAGLENTVGFKRYDRILVSRPIIPLGKDLGYMPGDKDEKLAHWMQPIFDNLSYLMSGGKATGNGSNSIDENIRQKVDKLLADHVVEMEALTYIRGRSIPRQYVIVDEAQNLTPHEIKTIISRAGEGTKMVLTGDPYQIDNPYLDSSSNGLAYAVERLKALPLHGHVTLRKSERSRLAAVAADYL